MMPMVFLTMTKESSVEVCVAFLFSVRLWCGGHFYGIFLRTFYCMDDDEWVLFDVVWVFHMCNYVLFRIMVSWWACHFMSHICVRFWTIQELDTVLGIPFAYLSMSNNRCKYLNYLGMYVCRNYKWIVKDVLQWCFTL